MFTELLQIEYEMAGTINKGDVKKWVADAVAEALSEPQSLSQNPTHGRHGSKTSDCGVRQQSQ